MKYKKDDKVVINPWGLMQQRHGLDKDGNIKTPNPFTVNAESQLIGRDRVVTINCENGESPILEFRSGMTCWGCDEMILAHAFEWGEEIEVSDDGDMWDKRLFLSYTPGVILPINVACMTMNKASKLYRFARPIRKPDVKLTVEIGGKILTASEIKHTFSAETWAKLRGGDNG